MSGATVQYGVCVCGWGGGGLDYKLTSLFTGSPSQCITVSGATVQYGVCVCGGV